SGRSTQFHRVAEAVAEREDDREELWVAREELVELAQRLRRGGLLRRANLSGHLPAPEKVVGDDDSADPKQRQREFEVLSVFFLQGVEEDEVERLAQAREHFESAPALDADALSQGRAPQVVFAARDHLV